MIDYTKQISEYFEREKRVMDSIDKVEFSKVINLLEEARKDGRQIFIMGNGGSAATASHYCGDFNKGISAYKDKRYRMICLNDNLPALLAYANDMSYADVFVEQLKNFYNPGDVVVGISGSGNSANVVNAMEWAKANGAVTIALTGYNGGKLKQIAEYGIHVPVDDMQITEDLHMVFDHCMYCILTNNGER